MPLDTKSAFPSPFQCYKPMHQKVYGGIFMSPAKRLLLVRGRKTGKWSFPKGHKERGEGYLECVMRETFEETGIRYTERVPFAYHKLAAGEYYFFDVDAEEEPRPLDTLEVEEAAWLSLEELRCLRGQVNVDVNYFLDRMRRGLRPATPLMVPSPALDPLTAAPSEEMSPLGAVHS